MLLDIPHADGALLLGWAAAAGIRAGGGDRNSLASEGSEKMFPWAPTMARAHSRAKGKHFIVIRLSKSDRGGSGPGICSRRDCSVLADSQAFIVVDRRKGVQFGAPPYVL